MQSLKPQLRPVLISSPHEPEMAQRLANRLAPKATYNEADIVRAIKEKLVRDLISE